MAREITVAAAQMVQRNNIRKAAQDVVRMVKRAARARARFLVTPEMILTGYHAKFDQEKREKAIDEVIRPACRENGITLILGAGNYRDKKGRKMSKPYIQALIIGPDGKIIGAHNKTCPARGDTDWCKAGERKDLRVFRGDGLTFGVTICNDLWATPWWSQLPDLKLHLLYKRKGASVIFHGAASGHEPTYSEFHHTRVEERAQIAGIWVVAAACIEKKHRAANAPTGILSPDGKWRVKAPLKGERLCVGKVRA